MKKILSVLSISTLSTTTIPNINLNTKSNLNINNKKITLKLGDEFNLEKSLNGTRSNISLQNDISVKYTWKMNFSKYASDWTSFNNLYKNIEVQGLIKARIENNYYSINSSKTSLEAINNAPEYQTKIQDSSTLGFFNYKGNFFHHSYVYYNLNLWHDNSNIYILYSYDLGSFFEKTSLLFNSKLTELVIS